MSPDLAPLVVKRLLEVFASLQDKGTGVLLIEQSTDLALGMADTALVPCSGRMRQHGPARHLSRVPVRLQKAHVEI